MGSLQASVSTSSPAGVDTTAFPSSEDDSVFDRPKTAPETLFTGPDTSDLSGARYGRAVSGDHKKTPVVESRQRTRIGKLMRGCTVTDLDYEIFFLEYSKYQQPNRIPIQADKGDLIRYLYPSKVATEVTEGPILAVTGTTGSVGGFIMKNPHYIRMNSSTTYQEMWPVQLDRHTSE